MKILHTLAQLPMRTGSGVAFSNMLKGFEAQGADNAVIYGVQDPFEFDFGVPAYEVVFKGGDLDFPIAGMSDEMPYENTVYSEMTYDMVQDWMEVFEARLEEAKEDFQPDILICHHLWYLTSLALDTFPDVPVIGVCHNTDIRQAVKNPELKYKYVHDMDRLAHVFALSESNKEDIIEVFGIEEDKITVVGGGFNQDIFHADGLKRDDETIRIIYAGKIARAKGVYELAKAYPNLKRKYPEIKMKFIGDLPEEEVDVLYENAHFMEGFRIYNVEDQVALGDDMRRSDIFVLPSYYEGLGLTAIEALACKLRVVATEIEGLMELLGDEVNQSGVIEYVDLPELYETDKPIKHDIDPFVQRLEEAIEGQIIAVKDGQDFEDEIYEDIFSHSWDKIVEREYGILEGILG